MKRNPLFFKLFFILLFFTNFSQAQFGIEANYGLAGVFEPSINDISHFGAGITYDFDQTYGVKLDFASDKFRTKNILFTEETGVDVTRISIQGTMNISSALSRTSSFDFFNVIAHAGGGYSMVKSSYNSGNDNVVNIIMGVTPRFKIADGLYLALDASTVFNISQHFNFDGSFSYDETINSFTGITYNFTAGLIYKFNEYY